MVEGSHFYVTTSSSRAVRRARTCGGAQRMSPLATTNPPVARKDPETQETPEPIGSRASYVLRQDIVGLTGFEPATPGPPGVQTASSWSKSAYFCALDHAEHGVRCMIRMILVPPLVPLAPRPEKCRILLPAGGKDLDERGERSRVTVLALLLDHARCTSCTRSGLWCQSAERGLTAEG